MGDGWSLLGVVGLTGELIGAGAVFEGLRMGMLVLLSLLWWPQGRFSERMPAVPLPPKALPWTLARGRSI
jgi:hypothetical protein